MNEKRQNELLEILRDMVAICEMDESFCNPEGGNYPLLRRAKIALNPQDYLSDHPTEADYAASLLGTKLSNDTVCKIEGILQAAETLPAERFDARYFGYAEKGQPEKGCLIWWYCRQNPKADLRLELERFSISAKTENTRHTCWYHTVTGLNALVLWLGISNDDVNYLFDHDYYSAGLPDKETAVNRLQTYLKSGGWINKEISK